MLVLRALAKLLPKVEDGHNGWGSNSFMPRLLLIIALTLLLSGCVHRPVKPSLAARHCAEGSYPVKAMYHDQVVTVCAIITPECAATSKTCPIVGFIPVGEVNTLLDPDADEAAKDKGEKKGSWWKFWQKRDRD